MKNIQFVDLYAQYKELRPEIDAAISRVISSSSFIRGNDVSTFEAQFASLINSKYCVSCGNGTDSLYIAQKALGVSPGDEIICPAHSWISTSETITQAGGKPVFCDTKRDHFTIDCSKLAECLSDKTVGIIPVHLYGQSADMNAIKEFASRHNLWIIEDCAQAHLCEYQGQKVGSIGTVGSFSFYPGKNLGAMGDAGALVTDNHDLATSMAMYARHGGLRKNQHDIEGINSRMDGLQAAILNVKIKYLSEWNERRKNVADFYLANISNPKIDLPSVSSESSHVWHLFVVRCNERDQLASYLASKSIPSVINYPTALPFLTAYRHLNHTEDQYPNAYYNQSRILSIPVHPHLSQDQMHYIVESLNTF